MIMSYILEALRKSERERQLGQAPSLPSLVAEPPPRRQTWLPWLFALLLGLNGAALFYFGFAGRETSRPPLQPIGVEQRQKPAESAGMTEKMPNIAVTEAPQPNPGSLGNPAAKTDTDATSSAEKGPMPEKPPEKAGRTASQSLPNEFVSANKRASAKKPIRARVTPESFEEELGEDRVPTENIARQADPESLPIGENPFPETPSVRSAITEEPSTDIDAKHDSIPLLSAMPADFQRRIPAIKVNMLAYSSVPEERFAVIDMVKYSRGDRLPGGAVLVDIRADSLVLELNGSRFRVSNR